MMQALAFAAAALALGAIKVHGGVINDTKYLFAFGDSYTTDGWLGSTNPFLGYAESCAAAGPNWAIELASLWPQKKPQLINLAVSGATANTSIVPCYLVDFITEVDGFDKYIQTNKSIAWNSKNSIFTVSIGTNDVDLSLRTADQPAGAQLHKRALDSYFSSVERLYRSGARAFVFNGIMPFDRAQHGIVLGATLQATLKAHIIDYSKQLEARVKSFCASKRDLSVCFYYDVLALGNELMNNYAKYGFLTPDGVCGSYGGPSCTADPIGDKNCLGPASKYIWRDGLHPAWRADLYWAQGIWSTLSRL